MERTNNPQLVPLVLVALEIGADAGALAAKLGAAVTADGIGLRCVTGDVARQVIGDHHDALRTQRERAAARQAELAANDPVPARRKRLRARPAATGDIPALALAMAAEHAARPLDEMMQPAGEALTYHPIRTTGD